MQCHLPILAIAFVTSVSAQAQDARIPDADDAFRSHPVVTTHRGPPLMPQFNGRDRAFRGYRTRLELGMRAGANFAGHVAMVEIGCGAGCLNTFAGDLRDGRVTASPVPGDRFGSVLHWRPDSRLLKAFWRQSPDEGAPCVRQDYIWEPPRFRALGAPRTLVAKACDDALEQRGF